MDNLFEQLATISKAHAFDIISKQVGELKEENEKLKAANKELLDELKKCHRHRFQFSDTDGWDNLDAIYSQQTEEIIEKHTQK